MDDFCTTPTPQQVDRYRERIMAHVRRHPELFREEFATWLEENLHVYRGFSGEAWKVRGCGRTHYSARTIVEVLRHNSMLREATGQWKLNNNYAADLSRLFMLDNPTCAGMFETRLQPGKAGRVRAA